MISMQAVSIAAQNDSQYRAEAEHLIDQLVAQIRIAVAHDVTTGNVDAASFASFAHRSVTDAACSFSASGGAIDHAVVTDWIKTVRGQDSGGAAIPGKGLPGVTDSRVQIRTETDINMPGINQLRISVCWQAAGDKAPHSHSVVAYID
jgi:hypothetical protein